MSLKRIFIRQGLRYDRYQGAGARIVYPWPRKARVVLWAAGAALLIALVPLGAWWQVRRQVPDFELPRIAGLKGLVEVRLDERGVPTVMAQEFLDALRVQGYLMARERMFQMELQRRAAGGELAEIAGEAALPLDRLHRTYGFAQAAEAAAAKLPEEDRAALKALADGVNAFITSHEGRWGLEFKLMGFKPRPWTPADSLRTLLLMHEDLSTSWKSELMAGKLAKLPQATRDFLMPRVVEGDGPLWPDAKPEPRPSTEAFMAAPPPPVADSPEIRLKKKADLGELPFALPMGGGLGRRVDGIGSNAWAVAGRRTTTGKALLANDPHLGLQAPNLWFPMRIELKGRYVQGVALPGLPGIVIGHNDRIAWGFTNLGTDVQDLYVEKPTKVRRERIAVKDGVEDLLDVPEGAHGPQVAEGYSLHWSALEPGNLGAPTQHLFASDWATFNAALDHFQGPAQNAVYADRDGHVGWRATGLIPLRRAGDDGSLPRRGDDPANDWKGYLPTTQLPRVLDPASGFVVTANNRTVGTSFPVPVTAEWASPSRARRIREQLGRSRDLDRAAMELLQRDEVSLAHRELMEAWLPFLPEDMKSRFLGWDGAAAVDSILFSEATTLNRALRKALLEKLLAGTAVDPGEFAWFNSEAPLLAALRAHPETWKRAGLGDKAAFLAEVVEEARKTPAKAWGETNHVRMRHPLGRAGRILSWLFDPPQAPIGGSSRSVRVTGAAFGQSMRMVVDWSEPEGTTLVLPLGVSGHYGSDHRFDQFTDWLKGDPEGRRTRLYRSEGKHLTFRP
ncbi:MAG TPA: penicillin acylase family protein [Holophagaceae bacterium]|nr:penicillin acylase family protein [Holophagaceae bacterium]